MTKTIYFENSDSNIHSRNTNIKNKQTIKRFDEYESGELNFLAAREYYDNLIDSDDSYIWCRFSIVRNHGNLYNVILNDDGSIFDKCIICD